jgi:hypothetical protein
LAGSRAQAADGPELRFEGSFKYVDKGVAQIVVHGGLLVEYIQRQDATDRSVCQHKSQLTDAFPQNEGPPTNEKPQTFLLRNVETPVRRFSAAGFYLPAVM